ncbi:MAG: hypothetical protein UY21_C0002G0010 [Microgenomates group bacterium GW2011_GWA1_48_10]|uniref:NYN domain-containing protein n=1 Tax=Candidatus Gottesmanbacteria bacterium RIFCSPHIGHO2_01_FULL_47_48 TaxID=1798381 RepID=A0A1F5ZZD6_9BACT|nr:MAG: hypothetical protein UY21_C0002G0010 [Microgenomates group bacterium GW2011_GWA1_48_10]OGG17821.1 MAG: hypothetical protein A2721_02250 [Candidatus Gottesmanbacteria bacterium RIFCSPHIGHO2_01_FULL_47_48]
MKKVLKLKGKTAVFIDWANVHGWQKSLKKRIDVSKLHKYLKSYKEIEAIRFYFGKDSNEGSKKFLQMVENAGYSLTTKLVKYILVAKVKGEEVYKRKCDFDLEICIDVHKFIGRGFDSFIFFSGDGDFEPVYQHLLSEKKQVIVVFAHGHMGREIYQLGRKIYTKAVDKLGADLFF